MTENKTPFNPNSQIFVQPRIWTYRKNGVHEHFLFADFLALANEHKYNLELATYAYSTALDKNWRKTVNAHKQALSSFSGKISLHGAFQDLSIHSNDSKIAKISKKRILQNLKIAGILDASYVVFHANFNPYIPVGDSYKTLWLERNAKVWSDILNEYDITILLENLWEPTPEIFQRLLGTVDSSRLRVCLDVGHVNIFSKVPLREWFGVLGDKIPYIHVSDNCGEVDNELVLGEGTIDWHAFSAAIEEKRLQPEVVIEVGTIEKTLQSIHYLEERGFYPFQPA